MLKMLIYFMKLKFFFVLLSAKYRKFKKNTTTLNQNGPAFQNCIKQND